MSSPYNCRSNGKAESAVKIAKKLFKGSTDPYLALLEWRNTPTIKINASPCQRLLARRTRGIVATSSAKLKWEPPGGMWGKKLGRQWQIQAQQEGKGRSLAPLRRGEWCWYKICEPERPSGCEDGRYVDQIMDQSGFVEVDGQLLHRNRQFLKPTPIASPLPLEVNSQAQTPEQQSVLEPKPTPPQVTVPCSPAQSQSRPSVQNPEDRSESQAVAPPPPLPPPPQETQKMKEGQVGLHKRQVGQQLDVAGSLGNQHVIRTL